MPNFLPSRSSRASRKNHWAVRSEVGDLETAIIDERGHRRELRKARRQQLGGLEHIAPGIADQGMRHGPDAAVGIVKRRRQILRGADEALDRRIGIAGGAGADRGAIGGEQVHLRAAGMAGMHVDEGGVGNGEAHLIGIVGRNRGDAGLLQHQRLDRGEPRHRPGDLEHLALGRNDLAFLVETLHPGGGDQPFDQPHHRIEGGNRRGAAGKRHR